MKYPREDQILATAIESLRTEAGVELEQIAPSSDDFDAIVRIKGEPDLEFAVEVKSWAAHSNIGALLNKLKSLPFRPLLVADYVNANMADRLREHGVEFVDTCGNAYINAPSRLFVFTSGHKPTTRRISTYQSAASALARAFEPSGLRVVFAFLCEPDLAEKPYRDIAAASGVAVGTVGWVIRGLNEGGYLVKHSKTRRRLIKRTQLLDRWVESFALKLRPKLYMGYFHSTNHDWWTGFKPGKYDSYWGGEIAGAKLTKNLRPEVATIYLPESRLKDLAMGAHLRKYNESDKTGMKVELYRMFWEPSTLHSESPIRELVPPILVYADLVATGDSRNLETARDVYERWIAGPGWKS